MKPEASDPTDHAPTPGHVWSLISLFSALFLAMVGFGLTLPVLPAFVERMALGPEPSPSLVAAHVGGLTSAYAVTQLMLAPFWGWWSDRHGARPLVFLGLVGIAFSQATFGLGNSLSLLYGSRLIGGGFAAALVVSATTTIARAVPARGLGRAMAWQGTALSLGFVAGPALGGLMADNDWHLVLPTGHLVFDGFSLPFFVSAGLALLALPLVLVGVEVGPRSREGERLSDPTESVEGWWNLARRLGPVLGLVFVAQAALILFEAVFALYADSVLGWGLREIGTAFALCGLVMAVFQGGLVGWVSGRIPVGRQLAVGFGLLGGGLVVLPLLTEVGPVLAAVGLLALGVAVVTPNLLVLAAGRSELRVGAGLGLLNASGGLGQVLGPLIGTLLFTGGVALPFVAAGVVALSVSGVLAWTSPEAVGGSPRV